MKIGAAARTRAGACGTAIVVCALLAACSTMGGARQEHGVRYTFDIQSTGCCTLIAHAGGTIDGNPYTDSREALLLSIRNGYRLVELDFDQTREGNWFIVHDWQGWSVRTGYNGALPPPTAAVRSLAHHFVVPQAALYSIAGTYTVMSLDDLMAILAAHPDVRIITDAKSDAAMVALIRRVKGTPAFRQFVFQAYSLEGLRQAAALVPEQQLILTTYLLPDWYQPGGFDAAFLSELRKYPHLFALTIPMNTAHDAAKMQRIKGALSIPVLVHGEPKFINSRNLHLQLDGWGVNGVYVD